MLAIQVQELVKQGMSYEDIAASSGYSVVEVKTLAGPLVKSEEISAEEVVAVKEILLDIALGRHLHASSDNQVEAAIHIHKMALVEREKREGRGDARGALASMKAKAAERMAKYIDVETA